LSTVGANCSLDELEYGVPFQTVCCAHLVC
jgi:hypothetical protein